MSELRINLDSVKLIAFDCDGVILDSNQIKTNAFYEVALRYGKSAADSLVKYHLKNGGISRYYKFNYLLKNILQESESDSKVLELVRCYGEKVFSGLLKCDVAPGLRELREKLPSTPWMIITGGDQQEIRDVFNVRGLSNLFNGGIFGSPLDKLAIIQREILEKDYKSQGLYIGDSRYDCEVAMQSNLKFIFASGWTEFEGWEDYCFLHKIPVIENVKNLL